MKIGKLNITVIVLGAISLAAEIELLGGLDPVPVSPDAPCGSTAAIALTAPVQNPSVRPPTSPLPSPKSKRFRDTQPSTTK